MSSDEDSETAEWEREQMLRGTQSRGQKYHQPRTERSSNLVDASLAKKHVNEDIEKAEAAIESAKRSIGTAKVDIVKSEKRIDAIRKRIEELESSNTLFEELGSQIKSSDILFILNKYRTLITKLPHDQKEMIDILEKKAKEAEVPMEADQ